MSDNFDILSNRLNLHELRKAVGQEGSWTTKVDNNF